MTARPRPSSQPAARLRVIQGRRFVRPRAWGWMLVAFTAVALFFALVITNTALDQSAFDLQEIRAQIAEEQTRFDQLRLEVARLKSPERIQPLAEQMGMVYPDPAERRTVTAEGVVVVQTNDDRWTNMKSIVSASP